MSGYGSRVIGSAPRTRRQPTPVFAARPIADVLAEEVARQQAERRARDLAGKGACTCGHAAATHNPYVPAMSCRGHHGSMSTTARRSSWPCSCQAFTEAQP